MWIFSQTAKLCLTRGGFLIGIIRLFRPFSRDIFFFLLVEFFLFHLHEDSDRRERRRERRQSREEE